MKQQLVYGVAALARPTFDVPFAESMKDRAFAALEAAGIRTVGPRQLLFDSDAAERAVTAIAAAGSIDALLILQVTFTDATMTVKLARDASMPLAIWALPEPRSGGRLRLNAYCGLNLAAHALGLAGIPHGWLYAMPDAPGIGENLRSLANAAIAMPLQARNVATAEHPRDSSPANRALAAMQGARITVVGQRPDGFDTCDYDAELLRRLSGIEINTISLGSLFDKARRADRQRVATVRRAARNELAGLDTVDQEQLDRSFRVFCALQDVQKDNASRGLAVRCWPEMFTEYGCAACGPMAMMNQQKVPSACEADVNGAVSQLLLQELAGEPAWMADLVDITPADDTAVLWHCGLAPLSMRDPQSPAQATIHTNRKMPLLHQFPIKPGAITLLRLSRARNQVKLMIASAEVIRAPMAFTGCSGTIRFGRSAADVARTIMEEGLEHHFALAYGDHKLALRSVAAQWGLPVLELA